MAISIKVACECEGTGYVAVPDIGGEDVEHVECGGHHPAYQDKFTIMDDVRTSDGLVGKVIEFDEGDSVRVGIRTIGGYHRRWYGRHELTKLTN